MVGSPTQLVKDIRRIVLALFPELSGRHLPVKGRVLRVYEAAGKMGPGGAAYAADVEVLAADGSPDPAVPVLPAVEISPVWAGPGRGIFCLPAVGARVRLGFYQSGSPFIDTVLGDGFTAPLHSQGTLIIQQSATTRIELAADGRILLVAPQVEVQGDLHVTGSVINP